MNAPLPVISESPPGAASSSGRWGVLLINLGTPDAPTTGAVRRYLRQFLSDPRVIDLPAIPRWLLLNLVILPFRPQRAAAAYRKVWTERGSPLAYHLHDLAGLVAGRIGGGTRGRLAVSPAMRYQQPSMESAVDALVTFGAERIFVLPLYPQYSSAATGSTVQELHRLTGRHWNTPALTVLPPFYDHPAFIRALAETTRPHLDAARADRVLFSFHGLPERQIHRSDNSANQELPPHCMVAKDCCAAVTDANRWCYRAQCYATARATAAALALPPESWEVAFQSRLGRTPWIQPYTDVRIRELPAEGVKRLAVLCPSFVADCLETTEEIGLRARADFLAAGGEHLELVPCLNSQPAWVEAIADLLRDAGAPIE